MSYDLYCVRNKSFILFYSYFPIIFLQEGLYADIFKEKGFGGSGRRILERRDGEWRGGLHGDADDFRDTDV